MAAKSGSSKKSGGTRRSVDAEEKDRIIARLKDRIDVLENELKQKQDIATYREAGDRKHAANGLSRALLDTLLTKAPIGFAFFDRELRYVLINDRLAEINGVPAADHIGKRIRDVVPSLVPAAQKVVDQILATGQPVKDHEFCGETSLMPGVMRYWSESWYPVRDGSGEIVGFGAIVEEITERKQAGDALKASEKNARQRADELEALMDMIPAAVWVSRDPDCRTIVGNKFSSQCTEAEAGKNISAGSARGEVYDRMRRFFKNGRELKPEELPMQEAVSKGIEVVNSEIDTLLPSGRRITVLGNAKPLRDANGQMCGCVSLFIDITERKRMDKALLEQERFRNIFETPLIGAAIGSPEKGWVLANDKICEMLGYTRDELKQLTWDQLTHPDDLQKDLEQFNRLLSGEIDNYTFDKRFIRKDGSVVYATIFVGAVRKADGSLDYDTSFMLDVTERKRFEMELRDSQAHLSSIFRAAPTGIGVVVDRMITEANDRLCEMTGHTRDELLGKSARMLYPTDEDYEYVGREKYEEIHRHGTGSVETRWQRKDGRVIDILLSSTPLEPDNLGAGVTFTALDITERKRTEEALTLTGYSLDNASDIVVWFDPDGRINYANNAACKNFGYTREEMLSLTIFDLNPRYTRESWNDRWMELKRKGSTLYEVENRAKDGRWFPIEATNTYIKFGDREIMFGYARDITERKRAEEALQESEHRYRALVETSPDGIIVQRDGKYLYANPAALRLHGADSLDQLREHDVLELIDPEDREQVAARIRHMEKGCIVPLHEGRLLRLDGRPVYFESAGTQINYGGGKATQVIIRDITKRKLAEDLLKERERQLAEAQVLTETGSWEMDLATGDVTFSDNLLRIVGLPPGRHTYEEFQARIHPEDRERRDAAVKDSIENGKPYDVEYRVVLPDNNVRHIHAIGRFSNGPQGTPVKLIATIQDITERKRAEMALRENHVLLDAITSNTPDHVYVKDRESRFIFVNPAVSNIFGMPREALIGRNPFEITDAAVAAAIVENDRQVMESGKTRVFEEMVRTVHGQRTFISTKTPRRNDKGEVAGLIGISIDITDRKLAEEALKDAKAQAELYLDLMGHDINNMHQIALGYLELALGMPPGVQRDEMIEKPIEVLQRSTQLIKNVRKLQKLNEGMSHYREADLVGVLSDVQREFGAVPGKTITLDLNGIKHCYVSANELLHDVFANLVGNAIKHTGEKADIRVGLDAIDADGGRYYRVSIEDDGPGIPDDFKSVIFNRILKGTKKAKGMGLGLYLVKSLVESYGGSISVEDRVPGDHAQGARFVVRLPAAQ